MVLTIVVVLLVVLLAVLALAASRPATYRVERNISIDAPPERIHPLIDDFREWVAWSPWEQIDPTMTRTHSGARNGRGAVYAWDGKGKAGAGRMEITESTPPEKIVVKLDFTRPFEGHSVTEYTLSRQGNTTGVTWAMTGRHNVLGRLMSLFVDMDRLVGGDFEKGLASLKRIAEGG